METIRDNSHSDRVIGKCQRIVALKALLKEWELSDNLDLDYIRGLRARLLSGRLVVSEQNRKRNAAKRVRQLSAMRESPLGVP
jgi:hypothetical protein